MKHKMDAQLLTLDFWLNRLLTEKYGINISGRIVGNKIYLLWWKGTCLKGKQVKVGEAKLKIEIEMPSKKQITKQIDKEMSK